MIKTAFMLVTLIRVIDGDTVKVDINGMHPLFGSNISVRVAKIDVPEKKCQPGRWAAGKHFAEKMFKATRNIKLTECTRGKYFRIVCDIELDGKDFGSMMRWAGFAMPYGYKFKCSNNTDAKK